MRREVPFVGGPRDGDFYTAVGAFDEGEPLHVPEIGGGLSYHVYWFRDGVLRFGHTVPPARLRYDEGNTYTRARHLYVAPDLEEMAERVRVAKRENDQDRAALEALLVRLDDFTLRELSEALNREWRRRRVKG